MKRIFTAIIWLLVSASLFAQVQTVVSGKVHSKPNKPVILLVYNFNTSTMTEEETTIQAKISDDSTFTISTDKVVRPFTRCRLGFNNEGQKIVLSPGDTLMAGFQYGFMETTTFFIGKGAEINNYLTKYQLNFTQNRKDDIWRDVQGRDTSLITSFTQWRNDKLNMLNSFGSQYNLDPNFLQLETQRINYEYYNDLILPDIMRYPRNQAYDSTVAIILGQHKYSDDNSLLDLKEYRNFITDYAEYKTRMSVEGKPDLQNRLDRINMELSGLSNTYCSYGLISNAISEASGSEKKLVLRNYFIKNTTDNDLVRLLDSFEINPASRNSRIYQGILVLIQRFLITIFFISLLIFILYGVRVYLLKKGRQLNPFVIARVAIYLLCLYAIIGYVSSDWEQGNNILPVLRVATLLLFVGVQIFWLIPVWFHKGRFAKYSLLLGLISIVYFFVLILMGAAEQRTHLGYQWLESKSILFIINSWLILVPFAFLNYYLNLLIRKGKGLNYLFKENQLNPEAVFHGLFLVILLSASITQSFRYQSNITEFIFIILGLSIFYFQTFYLIPRFLFRKRILIYLLGCLGGLAVTMLFVYLKNGLDLYLSISGLGINIPFIQFFTKPDRILVITALALQLLIVPSFIYAFVKLQLGQKTIGFKMFRNKEAELQQLRSQVNPHFLFNSLNTVYAFALKENHSKTAEYIAKLANLMRYLVDDMQKEKIPVKNEITYIRDYINLQAIRSSVEHKIDIADTIDEDQNIMIAPMLMIPFVENAFKHGINPNSISELKVNFQIQDNRFQFVIDNSVDKNFEAFYKEKGFGIGIENVRQRLAHIYPGKHTLSIADTGDRFLVILTIIIDQLD